MLEVVCGLLEPVLELLLELFGDLLVAELLVPGLCKLGAGMLSLKEFLLSPLSRVLYRARLTLFVGCLRRQPLGSRGRSTPWLYWNE